MTKKLDWKPWYRRKDYKGKLTEDQKRYLDSFRNGKPHPATSFNDLPEEVQERLTELECEVKEYQSNQAMLTMIAWITLGGYLCYRGYTSETLFGSASSYIVALGMFVMFYTVLKAHNSLQKQFNSYGNTAIGEPFSATDEALQRHWELNAAIAYKRTQSVSE